MIAWINFAVLLVSFGLMTYFYVRSVGPAALEQKIGEVAYKRCGRYRMIASVMMGIATVNYILYTFYPLPIDPFPPRFTWSYGVSLAIALVIGVPSLYLMLRGVRDAGKEAIAPSKEHTMYGGIYEKIRHPQAVGEAPLWWVMAFLLNSPFLVVFSFIAVPIWYAFCLAEEKDLLLRYGEAYEAYRQRTGMFLPRRQNG